MRKASVFIHSYQRKPFSMKGSYVESPKRTDEHVRGWIEAAEHTKPGTRQFLEQHDIQVTSAKALPGSAGGQLPGRIIIDPERARDPEMTLFHEIAHSKEDLAREEKGLPPSTGGYELDPATGKWTWFGDEARAIHYARRMQKRRGFFDWQWGYTTKPPEWRGGMKPEEVQMQPMEFLMDVGEPPGGFHEPSLKKIEKGFKKGEMNKPFLEIEKTDWVPFGSELDIYDKGIPRPTSHEGRHRALIAQRRGLKTIPVVIFRKGEFDETFKALEKMLK